MPETEIIDLIVKGESSNLEFKKSFNNEVIETLVAFANTYGGRVIVGITPKGEVSGITINAELVQNWVNEVKSKTLPVLIPDVEIVSVKGKTLVVFTIQEYPVKPVSTRGKYFKRVANSNHLLGITEVVNLHLQSFNTSWDYYVNNQFQIHHISLEKVLNAIGILNQSGTRISEDPLTFLIKNDLLRDGQLTNAAFLLFTGNETVLTTIELGRFQTDTIIKDSARTKSDLLTQVEQVMDFVKKHINKEVIITGQPRNTQKWQYPLEAIREIVVNMIVHRDYRAASDSIVKIYDNRIEFYNPGRLPDSITVDDLLSNNYKSTPRNKLIADFFKSIGMIEKYGSGIRRVMESFDKAELPRPEFRNISEGFQVTVFTEEREGKVSERVVEKVVENISLNQQKILNSIIKNPYISAKELSDEIEISHRKIQENIKKLKDIGLIKRVGPDKGGHWEIINP